MPHVKALALGLSLCLFSQPAQARTILLTNDDGLSSNLKALYEALKAEGHDVIVSVPCMGQSGMGAAIKFLRPLGPLAADCHNGAATKGAPGAGVMTREGLTADYHYVDGTPVMSLLYGLDVLARQRWGKAPDLILSGPNEGQNVGAIVISSGTVSNAQYGAERGIPSVALSAGTGTTDNQALANPLSRDVARLSINLIRHLERQAGQGPLLPAGTALNVNFPDKLDAARWVKSRIGTYNAYTVSFAPDVAETRMGKASGLGAVHLPGITLDINEAQPTAAQRQDESIVARTDIAVSVMQIGYEHSAAQQKWLGAYLRTLFSRKR